MSVTLVLPRDSWSALALALLVTGGAGGSTERASDFVLSAAANYARYELAPHLVLTYGAMKGREGESREDEREEEQRLRQRCVPMRIGSESLCRSVVFVALPSPAQLFYDGSRRWADYAQWEAARQYTAWCRIAVVQTVGGGWASLRRADKALACAMELYELAQIVGDGDIASKCRVFIGWAHLWSGRRETAVHLFSLELRDAVMRGDTVHRRRCENAITNATTNPTLNGTAAGSAVRRFTLTDCWRKAFAGADVLL